MRQILRQSGAIHNRQRGYTLIELLLIMSIMGIVAAIVVPQMLRPGTLTIQAAGRMVIADILHAQQDAIAQQQVRRLVFDTDANHYRLTDLEGTTLGVAWKTGGAAAENYVVDLANDSRFTGVSLSAVDFGGSDTLEFDDLGAPANGGSVDLVFEDVRYRVSVAPFTGRVTIEPITSE
jgi:prepilin-type N-terminal cleavage/methylation domain-containing protein